MVYSKSWIRFTPVAIRPATRLVGNLNHVRFASTAPSKVIKIAGREVSVPTGIFINNEFRKSIGGNAFAVENPGTGKEILQIEEGREEDVEAAVQAARKAFQSEEWSTLDPVHRGELLTKLATLMERDKEDIIALEMLDTGKTYRQASNLDFPGSVSTLKYYAGWADKVTGMTSFNIPKTFAYTRREPIGVCGQIIPWKSVIFLFPAQDNSKHG